MIALLNSFRLDFAHFGPGSSHARRLGRGRIRGRRHRSSHAVATAPAHRISPGFMNDERDTTDNGW